MCISFSPKITRSKWMWFCFNCRCYHSRHAKEWPRCATCNSYPHFCGAPSCDCLTKQATIALLAQQKEFDAYIKGVLCFLYASNKPSALTPSQEEQTESVATDHKDKKAQNTVSPSQPRMQPEHNVVAPTRSGGVKQCKYFNAGRCRFGDKCHNLHDAAQPQRRVAVRVPITATPNHNGKKKP